MYWSVLFFILKETCSKEATLACWINPSWKDGSRGGVHPLNSICLLAIKLVWNESAALQWATVSGYIIIVKNQLVGVLLNYEFYPPKNNKETFLMQMASSELWRFQLFVLFSHPHLERCPAKSIKSLEADMFLVFRKMSSVLCIKHFQS